MLEHLSRDRIRLASRDINCEAHRSGEDYGKDPKREINRQARAARGASGGRARPEGTDHRVRAGAAKRRVFGQTDRGSSRGQCTEPTGR